MNPSVHLALPGHLESAIQSRSPMKKVENISVGKLSLASIGSWPKGTVHPVPDHPKASNRRSLLSELLPRLGHWQ
jgi:hypothetical protein